MGFSITEIRSVFVEEVNKVLYCGCHPHYKKSVCDMDCRNCIRNENCHQYENFRYDPVDKKS